MALLATVPPFMSSSAVPQPSSHDLQSSTADALAEKQDIRVCSSCKRVQIPTNQPWKRCPSCREKSRNYKKKYTAARVALATMKTPNETSPVTSGKRKEREDELEGKADRLDGMKKKMRKHFKEKPIGPSENTSLPVMQSYSNDSNYVEYQTARDMYKALKKCRSTSAVFFRACFSIVAVSNIDHEHRLSLVVRELRKIAKWSFDREHPMPLGSGTEPLPKSVATSYHCTCRKGTAVPAEQTTSTRPSSVLADIVPASAPLKPKQSDLTGWITKKPSPSPSVVAATVTCKGKLTILVEEDNSHPVKGIKGQKITVTIAH